MRNLDWLVILAGGVIVFGLGGTIGNAVGRSSVTLTVFTDCAMRQQTHLNGAAIDCAIKQEIVK